MEKILWRRKFNEVTMVVGQRSELYLRGGKGEERRGGKESRGLARFPGLLMGRGFYWGYVQRGERIKSKFTTPAFSYLRSEVWNASAHASSRATLAIDS